MHLSCLGLSSFKIETKGTVIVTDPYSPQVAEKPLRAKADIVTVSDSNDPAHNYLGGIQGEPFVIDHPGEFEMRGVFIQGISAAGLQGNLPRPPAAAQQPRAHGQEKSPGLNSSEVLHSPSRAHSNPTIFTFDIEGMRLAHLGDIWAVPSGEVLERMNGVDVLFLPVGGGPTIDAERAVKILNDIEPRMVVPMHFAQEGFSIGAKLKPVSVFLKEMGASGIKPVERLLLKKKELPTEEETQVVVFQA